jgi:hypothetical protein
MYPDIDICLGDYDKKDVVHTDMAIFNWDNTLFMSKEEIKKLPAEKKKKAVPPVMFDLSKASKVTIDKADLKVQEIQA